MTVRLLATEAAVFYFAFASWRAEPDVPAGASAFTYHRRSSHGALLFVILLLLLVEGLAVHLLFHFFWSPIAAWIFTLLTIYGAIWLIGDYRAALLRPILVTADRVVLRAGLRATLEIPRDRIAEVVTGAKPDHGKESRSFALLTSPTHWIALSEAMQVHGPYGLRFPARAIGITPDDPERLLQSLVSREEVD